MKKVLIFGVGGFVGDYLSRAFIDKNYEVYGTDIVKGELLSEKVIFSTSDITNKNEVSELIEKVMPDYIINLAAISSVGLSWKIPQKTLEINTFGTLNIIEAAREKCPGAKLLLIGSSEEYLPSDKPISEEYEINSNNPYGMSKMMQENLAQMYVENYGMNIVCVRSFNHTGVGQKESFVLPSFCKQAAEINKTGKDGTIYVGNLSAERDFSDVRDIVRAYVMLVESNITNGIYNVGSGDSHTIQEMLDYICSLADVKINVQTDPERYRPVDTPYICCDHSKITKELGWRPEYTVFDAIKKMYDHFLK